MVTPRTISCVDRTRRWACQTNPASSSNEFKLPIIFPTLTCQFDQIFPCGPESFSDEVEYGDRYSMVSCIARRALWHVFTTLGLGFAPAYELSRSDFGKLVRRQVYGALAMLDAVRWPDTTLPNRWMCEILARLMDEICEARRQSESRVRTESIVNQDLPTRARTLVRRRCQRVTRTRKRALPYHSRRGVTRLCFHTWSCE